MRNPFTFSAFVVSFLYSLILSALEPAALYLTWIGDPTSSMTVVWQTKEGDPLSEVYYRGKETSDWTLVKGWIQEAAGSGIWVHVAEIEGLSPDGVYAFKIGSDGEVHWFRTLPENLEREVRIAVGGDAYMDKAPFIEMCREVATRDPDFVVIGGDIAYTIRIGVKGLQAQAWRWSDFFTIWKKEMVGQDGRLIPLVPVVGNHDVPRRKAHEEKEDVLFYSMFPFPKQGQGRGASYRTLDCGSYLSLLLLDTGHTYPVEGAQTLWLQEALEKRKATPYRMAIYHVAAYPSFYPFDSKTSAEVRKNWVPLFEEDGVQVAFEHHNHCYKRSFRLKEGKKDENGVLYLGDGCWGVSPRQPREGLPYLAKTASVRSYFLLRLDQSGCRIEPRGLGRFVDSVVEISSH